MGLTYVDSPSGFTDIFILHENIRETRVVTLSANELGTMSKNNLRDYLENKTYIRCVWEINSLILFCGRQLLQRMLRARRDLLENHGNV